MALTPKNLFDSSIPQASDLSDNDRIGIGQANAPTLLKYLTIASLKTFLSTLFQSKNDRLTALVNLAAPQSSRFVRLRSDNTFDTIAANFDQVAEPTGNDRFNGCVWWERDANNNLVGLWVWVTSESLWRNAFQVNTNATRGGSAPAPTGAFYVASINTKLDSDGQARKVVLVNG